MTNVIINCATLAVITKPTAEASDIRLQDGIEAPEYRFANGGVANFVCVGGRTEKTGNQRIQHRIADGVPLAKGTRSKAVGNGEREDREVDLVVEAQFIEMRDGRQFFGISDKWHRRAPEGMDPASWLETLPTEGYIMIIGQKDRLRVEGGRVLSEGFTEKYGEIFGHVQLVRVRLGEVAKLVLIGEDGSEATFELEYDAKTINARRC